MYYQVIKLLSNYKKYKTGSNSEEFIAFQAEINIEINTEYKFCIQAT